MNSKLYNNTYKIPDNIINSVNSMLIKYPNGNGVKRAKNIVNNRYLTYQSLKRFKNFFESPQIDSVQYNLAGGDLMKDFVNSTLESQRDGVEHSNSVRREIGVGNSNNVRNSSLDTVKLHEGKNKIVKNVVAVIVNKDNKFLLLKRSDYPKQWMPNKWSLVGGMVEKNEKPEKACAREIEEETKLKINDFVQSFTIQRDSDTIEYVFACRYNGDDTDIELDKENVKYGWYGLEEINYLDTVPNIIEYLMLVFKKYD